MELVEGPTLAERIQVGPIPLDEALSIAKQIAEALDYAHENGIIHRDLKPANVKLRPEGAVKVLDFGLAKAIEREPAPASNSLSPTFSLTATRAGVILGTAAYMSPEQARGQQVDKRTDIWAFGCVLYEMLAGKGPFHVGNAADTFASVITGEPDWAKLPPSTPPYVGTLLRRCLQKNRAERLRDIGDALWELKARAREPASRPLASRRTIPWLVAASLAVVALALSFPNFRGAAPAQPVIKLSLNPPEKEIFGDIAISPDGRKVAFTAMNPARETQLWVRPLDATDAQPLSGTEGAGNPFWSPDSAWIGFWADGKLKKISASGGPAQIIASTTAALGRGASWGREGVIVYAPTTSGPLFQVSAAGGEPKPVTELDAARREASHRWPQFFPDGRRFLYFNQSSMAEQRGIYLGSLNSKEKVRLLAADASAAYAAGGSGRGYLLFLREQTLMAQPFDPDAIELSGEALTVAEPVGRDPSTFRSRISLSSSGVLAYVSFGAADSRLGWFDRSGRQLSTLGPPGRYVSLDLAPDGQRAAADRIDRQTGNTDIWLFDVARETSTRLTFHPAVDNSPVWSPDGSRVAFRSSREGSWTLYEKPARGAGEEQLLMQTSPDKIPLGWSKDGRFLLYQENDITGPNLWLLPLDGDRRPVRLRGESRQRHGRLSPDGRWLAYGSDESGRYEINVRPFSTSDSAVAGKWQISTAGGVYPRWRLDGKELFYLALDGRLMAADVKTGGALSDSFEADAPRPLFLTRANVTMISPYAVAPDGQRFLIVFDVEDAPPAPLTVMVNWTAALKQ